MFGSKKMAVDLGPKLEIKTGRPGRPKSTKWEKMVSKLKSQNESAEEISEMPSIGKGKKNGMA